MVRKGLLTKPPFKCGEPESGLASHSSLNNFLQFFEIWASPPFRYSQLRSIFPTRYCTPHRQPFKQRSPHYPGTGKFDPPPSPTIPSSHHSRQRRSFSCMRFLNRPSMLLYHYFIISWNSYLPYHTSSQRDCGKGFMPSRLRYSPQAGTVHMRTVLELCLNSAPNSVISPNPKA